MTDGASDLSLGDLHENHPGICEALSGVICGAAAVCLLRHGEPPTTFSIIFEEEETKHRLQWSVPTQTTRNSHRNESDASRDGAYALALIGVDERLGLKAISRAEQGTGADWYLAPAGCGLGPDGEPDLEHPGLRRLEVAGRDSYSWRSLLSEKANQILAGASEIPGNAAAVRFSEAIVGIERLAN